MSKREEAVWYTYREANPGVVLLRPDGEEFLYLQPGDEANAFRNDVELLTAVWEGNPRFVGPFCSTEEHLSVFISSFDMGND